MVAENIPSSPKRNFFINQNFVMIWIGGTIARLSEGFLFTTFGLWIFNSIAKDQSSAATTIKGIVIVAMLALFVLGPLAGVFVDRWRNKKRILLTTSALRAICALIPIAGALFLSLSPTHAPWMTAFSLISIYLGTFLISTLTHFSIPVSYVLFSDCVKERDFSHANGLLLTTSFLGAMIGPPLGIILYSTIGFPGAILFDGLLYMGTFFATTRIHIDGAARKDMIPRQSFFRDSVDGVVFFLKNSLLSIMLITLVLINIWNGALTMLGVSFITQNLHTAYAASPIYVPEGFYGTIGITIGIGFIVGSFFFGLIVRRMGRGRLGEKRVFSYSLLLAGVCMLAVSRLTMLIPAIGAIFLISVLAMGINVTAVPLYLWVTPRHFLGRVRAVVDVATNLTAVVAGAACLWVVNSFIPGLHAQFFGLTFTPVDTVFSLIGVLCLVSGIFVVRSLTNTKKAGTNATEAELTTSIASDATVPKTILEPSVPGKR